jgi:hypothetical protein
MASLQTTHFMGFVQVVVLSLFGVACAAIGPKTDLVIENFDIKPDGFTRRFVSRFPFRQGSIQG